MRYIYFTFEGNKFWIELDDDSYAIRQIIFSDDGYHVSCLEDCLAEGQICDSDLSEDIIDISSKEFEIIWEESLKNYKAAWRLAKEKYKINDLIIGNLLYYYPQGAIFKCNDVIINYKGKEKVDLYSELKMKVVGYDDTNMWVITNSYPIEQGKCSNPYL